MLEARLFFGKSRTRFPRAFRKFTSAVLSFSRTALLWSPKREPRSGRQGGVGGGQQLLRGCAGSWGPTCFSHRGKKGHCVRAAFHSKGMPFLTGPRVLAHRRRPRVQGEVTTPGPSLACPGGGRWHFKSCTWERGPAGGPRDTEFLACVCLLRPRGGQPSGENRGQLESLMQFLEHIEISTTNIRPPNTVCYGYTVDNVTASRIVCVFSNHRSY